MHGLEEESAASISSDDDMLELNELLLDYPFEACIVNHGFVCGFSN